jgi:hypothetical protein
MTAVRALLALRAGLELALIELAGAARACPVGVVTCDS